MGLCLLKGLVATLTEASSTCIKVPAWTEYTFSSPFGVFHTSCVHPSLPLLLLLPSTVRPDTKPGSLHANASVLVWVTTRNGLHTGDWERGRKCSLLLQNVGLFLAGGIEKGYGRSQTLGPKSWPQKGKPGREPERKFGARLPHSKRCHRAVSRFFSWHRFFSGRCFV